MDLQSAWARTALLCLLLVTMHCPGADPADVIYYGGDLVTINDKQPTAEAVAVQRGKIVAVGKQAEVMQFKGDATKLIDLKGKTLLPSFIDGHSHFFQAAQVADYVNVSSPPVGTARNIADILTLLKARVAKKPLEPGEWLIGYGYDRATLTDGREMTLDDLDKDFPNHPVVIVHVSGHGCVLNSAAFRAVKIDASTQTPEGGVIARKPGSREPAGLLMESAWIPVLLKFPKPTAQQNLANFEKAQQIYASNGITTIQDAPMEPGVFELYSEAADKKLLYLDLISYCSEPDLPAFCKKGFDFRKPSRNHWRVAGVKVIVDGLPQGKTAYFTKPFLTGGPTGQKDYRGVSMVSQAEFNVTVQLAYEHNAQVLAHVNGDAAIDLLIAAHEAAGRPKGRRTTPVHSQFVRRDQLVKFADYDFTPSFFTNHTYFWGDVHVRNLGKDRAYFLSPLKTARSRGLRFANHSDFLVTPPNPLFILWTSVNRVSRSGKVIGPKERVTPLEGLKALTIDGAHMYFEEAQKGSLEVGKLADLVILDKNPLKVKPMAIKDIKVLETIKEGKSVYTAKER